MKQHYSSEYKVICFDFDGVILDTHELLLQLLQKQFKGLNRGSARAAYKENIFDALERISYMYEKVSDEEWRDLLSWYRQEKMNADTYDGIKDLLKWLWGSNYSLCVNSSAKKSGILKSLEKNDIKKYFSHIYGREISHNKLDKLTQAAKDFNCSLSEILFLTDTTGDLQEASRLNVATIGCCWGIHNQNEFEGSLCQNLIGIAWFPRAIEKFLSEK